MGTRDPRVDAYIADSAEFAQPILTRIRETVHQACPEVEEGIKWSHPHFMYHGMLCGMSSFKEHCAFGFWKGALVVPAAVREGAGMGDFGRITRVAELPAKRVLAGYIHQAMKLNRDGVKVARPQRKLRPPIAVPADLKRALAGNRRARTTFEQFSPSQRRDYLEWITEAKAPETRARRLTSAIEWMAVGKSRNWKYEK